MMTLPTIDFECGRATDGYKMKNILRRQENIILTILMLVILWGLTALRYDFYYDLNDDVLIKDIVAGVYTGAPESRNIQMLYLVSAFLSLFYRLFPALPWYGIFLCICQFGSIGLIAHRSLRFVSRPLTKVLLLTAEGIVVGGLMLEHLVFVQYTITGTMLAAAAAFLFLTAEAAGFLKNIASILLVFAAFLIRSEMLLLVLPLICAAGIWRWGNENPAFTRPNFIKYLSVFGGIVAGLALGQVTHMVAYGSAEWQRFTEFFDNRTELYDYQKIPEYDSHAAFYEEIGLTESEAILLHNYNFGLDAEIDEKLVGQVARYAAAVRQAEKPFGERFAGKAKDYLYRLTHSGTGGDFPWNSLVVIGYVSLLGIGINRKKPGRMSWKLLLLLLVRTGLWMYILMGDREPPRITHSLYYMECCILWACFLTEYRSLREEGGNGLLVRFLPAAAGLLILAAAGLSLPGMTALTDRISLEREETNRPWQAMQAYCLEHKDNYYFIDVYSSVKYSQKMFKNVDNRPVNYDLMGGWAVKSPLYEKKLAAFQIPAMEEALLASERVYVIAAAEEDLSWLEEYYRGHGQNTAVIQTDSIGESMGVYQVVPAD